MAGSVNLVILVGNLGKEPEVKTMQNGNKVVNLSLATSESWKDRASGERKEKTEWHRIVVFDERAASFAADFLKKGIKVYVEGSLQTRKWTDQSGAERYSTEVVVKQFSGKLTALEAVGGGGDGDGDRGESRPRQDSQQRQGGQARDTRAGMQGGGRGGGQDDGGGGSGGGWGNGGGGRDTRPGMGGGQSSDRRTNYTAEEPRGGKTWGGRDLDDEIPF